MNSLILFASVFCALTVLIEGAEVSNCDFESGVCSWINGGSSDADWWWSDGQSVGPDGKPVRDVTISNIAGHYIYADLASNDTAVPTLVSPLIPKGNYCFLFYIYSTSGDNAGVKVIAKPVGQPVTEVKTAISNRDNTWRRARAHLNFDHDFKIKLQGVLLNGQSEAVVALDEFHLMTGNCNNQN